MVPIKKLSLSLTVLGLVAIFIATAFYAPLLAKADMEDVSPLQAPEDAYQIFLPSISSNQSIKFIQHDGQLLSYLGAATCLNCHEDETLDFAVSNHYLWDGKFGTINDYCSYPDINFGPGKLTTVNGDQVDGGCAICHAGLGAKPTTENPENADCLTCHADEYRRTAVDVNGSWRFRPDYERMPEVITIQAEPSRKSCLTCHTYAGGGQNNKRGDISDALINPTANQDVHMNAGMT